MIKGDGPCNAQRMERRVSAHEEGRWVREAAQAYAAKHQADTIRLGRRHDHRRHQTPTAGPAAPERAGRCGRCSSAPAAACPTSTSAACTRRTPQMALRNARDVYTRRGEGVSIWIVPSAAITASSPDEKDPFFDPAMDKAYRHPTFYDVPEGVSHL